MRKMIHERKRSLKRKIFIMSCIVIVLSVMFLGSVAYLQRISIVENQFEIGETTIKVEENFNEAKTQKNDICLVNEGNISAYMRAKVLLYYVDVENNVLDIVPKEGVDYTIEQGSSDWIRKDDVYYYKTPIEPSTTNGTTGKTANLINCINDLIPNDDKYLVVDILGESIQATPVAVVEEAWKVKVDDETGHIESISIKEDVQWKE